MWKIMLWRKVRQVENVCVCMVGGGGGGVIEKVGDRQYMYLNKLWKKNMHLLVSLLLFLNMSVYYISL